MLRNLLTSAAFTYVRIVGLRGLCVAIWAKVVRKERRWIVRNANALYPIELRIPSSDVRTYQQVFVDKEYDFSVSSEPVTIVDAGANVGLASICFANRFPHSTVIAIEPEAGNFDLLKKNVAHYPQIIPLHAALWNEVGEIDLVDPGFGKWGFVTKGDLVDQGPDGEICHRVRAITVNSLMDIYGLTSIDILKVDIEGAEKEVFADTSSWLSRVGAIIIELHDRMKPGCSRSFYNGSGGFDAEWQRGENVYLARGGRISRR